MANKTYLELVNDVLVRLREAEVQTVSQTSYSKLISKFINDGKRQVEDAFDWNALRTTIAVNTTIGAYKYTLTGAGIRFKVIDVINDTDNYKLDAANTSYMNELFLSNPPNAAPQYYNFNGVDSSNDTQVDIFPIPDAVYNIKFNVIKPQDELSSNTDVLLVPNEPVIFYAYARALAERGEDGGLISGEAYQLYLQSLADHVSIESVRVTPDNTWVAN